jgi:AcrR family transcriptional regulator
MARPIPQDRLSRLVEVATHVFIEQGFQRTRMEDIAEALGVAKGTTYLYVESKEALFDFVCRSADQPFVSPASLPLKTPPAGSTVAYIAERLASGQAISGLADGRGRPRLSAREELEAIIGDLYDTLHRNRLGIKLVDRSARDIPELGQVWFGGARGLLVDGLASLLSRRIRAGKLRPVPHARVAARFVVETCAFWAVHRHWDAAKDDVDETSVRASVIDLVSSALLPRASSATRPKKE